MNDVPHVALLIETSRSYGRGLLRGVRRYIAEHGPWSVYLELRALTSGAPPWLENWSGDGILTRTGSQTAADQIAAVGVPTIELRATKLDHPFPFMGVDNRALGDLIASDLIDRGFRHLACYALATESFFEERCSNFIETARSQGCTCDVFDGHQYTETPDQWEDHQQQLVDWIISLPKPVGIMACTDQLGFWLLDACDRAGVSVPAEVAVIGAENDESLCEMANPPLSSVWFNAERTGYEAAKLLAAMMKDGVTPPAETLFPSGGVVTRRSSDVISADDELVTRALQYIRDNAADDIRVGEVAEALYVSRSVLERRMRKSIGRSPKSEIIRARLQLVQDYLLRTSLPLTEIAVRTGFQHPQYMSELFKKKVGQTPGQFRENFRKSEQ
jgi:LacI family transcriptional regulator